MTDPTPKVDPPVDNRGAPMATLSQERLRVDTEWVVSGHVRLRRRIVAETCMVEVTVRREELSVETDAAVSPDGVITGPRLDGSPTDAPALQPPIVLVLREEVPEVVTRTRAYEQVTVHVGIVQTEQEVSGTVRAEAADVVVEPVT